MSLVIPQPAAPAQHIAAVSTLAATQFNVHAAMYQGANTVAAVRGGG